MDGRLPQRQLLAAAFDTRATEPQRILYIGRMARGPFSAIMDSCQLAQRERRKLR